MRERGPHRGHLLEIAVIKPGIGKLRQPIFSDEAIRAPYSTGTTTAGALDTNALLNQNLSVFGWSATQPAIAGRKALS
jgi:hypothetical protein